MAGADGAKPSRVPSVPVAFSAPLWYDQCATVQPIEGTNMTRPTESTALRMLRTSLRLAADDLRELEFQIKYGLTGEAAAFTDAQQIAGDLVADLAAYADER